MKWIGRVVLSLLALIVLIVAVGVALLWRPDIPYATLETRYATPTSHFIDLPDGVRAHYRDDGKADAPVVLLVHGFGDSFLSWTPWIDVLSKDFRVITVDVPGHGLTRAPADYVPSADAQVRFIDEFAAATHLPPFAIAGNSMGGGIAWRTTLAHPERVRALILIDAAGFANEHAKPPPLAFQLLGTPAGRWALEHLETRPLTKASLQASLLNDPLVTDAFVNRWVEVQRAPGHRHILMTTLGVAGGPANPADLAHIHVPTLVLWGERDPLIEVAAAHKFADAISGAQLITYADVGHMPQLEVPERSANDADAFLKHALAANTVETHSASAR
ncbi:MAG: alpha/beta hydrolase [Pseudomonadota bacterium]